MVIVEMRGAEASPSTEWASWRTFWSWDEQIAEDLAKEDGLELSEHHWAVIRFLREYYSHTLIPPRRRKTLRALGASGALRCQLASRRCSGCSRRAAAGRRACSRGCRITTGGRSGGRWMPVQRLRLAPLRPSTRRAAHAAP